MKQHDKKPAGGSVTIKIVAAELPPNILPVRPTVFSIILSADPTELSLTARARHVIASTIFRNGRLALHAVCDE